jgi:hypothetical protein
VTEKVVCVVIVLRRTPLKCTTRKRPAGHCGPSPCKHRIHHIPTHPPTPTYTHQWSWEDPSTLVHSKPMALEAYGTRSLWHSKPMALETCGTYRLSGPRHPVSPPVSTVDSVAPYPVPTVNLFILEGPVDAEIIRLYYYRRVRRFNSASVVFPTKRLSAIKRKFSSCAALILLTTKY